MDELNNATSFEASVFEIKLGRVWNCDRMAPACFIARGAQLFFLLGPHALEWPKPPLVEITSRRPQDFTITFVPSTAPPIT